MKDLDIGITQLVLSVLHVPLLYSAWKRRRISMDLKEVH